MCACVQDPSEAAHLAGVFALPRPAFDAFHRQHQAQRNLNVGRVIRVPTNRLAWTMSELGSKGDMANAICSVCSSLDCVANLKIS